MTYALSIIDCPTGLFTLVGSVPTSLCTAVPASQADVMGGRAFQGEDGSLQTWKVPTFATRKEAEEFCMAKGVKVHRPARQDVAKLDKVAPSAVTRTQFCTALRQCLKEDFAWAADAAKLDNFMASVQKTLEGAKTVIHDGPSFCRAWRMCGLSGKPTFKGLHAFRAE